MNGCPYGFCQVEEKKRPVPWGIIPGPRTDVISGENNHGGRNDVP